MKLRGIEGYERSAIVALCGLACHEHYNIPGVRSIRLRLIVRHELRDKPTKEYMQELQRETDASFMLLNNHTVMELIKASGDEDTQWAGIPRCAPGDECQDYHGIRLAVLNNRVLLPDNTIYCVSRKYVEEQEREPADWVIQKEPAEALPGYPYKALATFVNLRESGFQHIVRDKDVYVLLNEHGCDLEPSHDIHQAAREALMRLPNPRVLYREEQERVQQTTSQAKTTD